MSSILLGLVLYVKISGGGLGSPVIGWSEGDQIPPLVLVVDTPRGFANHRIFLKRTFCVRVLEVSCFLLLYLSYVYHIVIKGHVLFFSLLSPGR